MPPRRLLLSCAAGFTALLAPLAYADGPLHFQRIWGVGMPQRSFVVINSQEELVKYATSTPYPEPGKPGFVDPNAVKNLPKIDFAQWTLLVAALGPITGHLLLFHEVLSVNGKIYAHLWDYSPGHACAVPQIIGYPSAAVLIPHTQDPVTIELMAVSHDCDIKPVFENGSTP